MQFKELTQGFTFVQEKGGFIEAYDTNGNITGANQFLLARLV